MPGPAVLIAHRAGNDLSRMEAAFAAGADYVEADVWLFRGRLEARHEKTAMFLPLLWDRWYLRPGWKRRLSLRDALAHAARHGKLLLDLKGNAVDLVPRLAGEIEEAGAAGRVAFTGHWPHLDRAREALPSAPHFYSLGSVRRLRALGLRLERREIDAVSVDSRFLTREVVRKLRACGVETIITWAVEDAGAAQHVLDMGVDGITTKDLELIAALRGSG